MDNIRLKEIRESERKSHIEVYSNKELFEDGSWLKKPVKTVCDLFLLFCNYQEIRVLDLGSGVGRNSIPIAQYFQNKSCTIDCVDILPLAIEKLEANARKYNVSSSIKGIVMPIEEYSIKENNYDLIMAISALEHIDSKESFNKKLMEISKGIREKGIVCLIMNSDIREKDNVTGEILVPQFEVNFATEELQNQLSRAFMDWEIIKSSIQEQQYEIPRETKISRLKTSVVTFVARKPCKQRGPL